MIVIKRIINTLALIVMVCFANAQNKVINQSTTGTKVLRVIPPDGICEVIGVTPLYLNFAASSPVIQYIYVEAFLDSADPCSNWIYNKPSSLTWITLTKIGDNLRVTVSANTGAERSGVITIGIDYDVTIHQDAACTPPAAPTAASQTFCSAATVASLASTPPSGCVTEWFTTSSGGTALNSSTSLSSTTYYAQSRNINTGCVSSTRMAVSVSIYTSLTNTLTSAAGTNMQTKCINTAITNITYSTSGATGATFSGLPSGVNGTWSNGVATISGTPSVSGIFNYIVTATNPCASNTTGGTITVRPNATINLTSAAGTDAQTRCVNTAITSITYATTGASGATCSGLPTGITGAYNAGIFTISGTPTVSGTFSYTVTATGSCAPATASGTITVSPQPTAPTTPAVQSFCAGTTVLSLVSTPPAGCITDWYDHLGFKKASNVVLSTGTYHAESRNLTTGCTSGTRTAVSVTIYAVVPSPSFPVAQSFCAGATVSSLASTPPSGSVTDWYSVSTGGTALAGTTVLTTGQYFAQSRSTSTGCVSVTRYPVNVTVNALPTVYAVTGGGTYCSGGAGVIVGLNGSQTGVNYQLKLGTGNVGSPVSGSGSGISFGNVTGAGTYTVLATNATTGCSNTMNGSAVVAINPLPTVYLIQGGGGFCTGESVVNVYMNSTVSGVKYELYKDGVNTGVNFYGNGYGQNFLTHTSAVGTYTAKGTITSTGCSIAMSGSVTVTEFLKPTPTLIASSNSICPGTSVTFTAGPGSGTAISTYDFKVNGVSKQIGTNNTFITNALVNNDVVTIESTTINGCKATSAGITITVNPLPNSYVVTGFSGYCSGGNGVAIGLNGSQVGVNYQLKLEGNSVGLPISGSGAALNFGNQMATGKYKVLGTNTSSGCFKEMGNDLTVSIYPLPTPTLSASKTTICQGDNVAFTAGTGSGVSITNYNFKINGVSKQNGSSATFSANTLLNNDLVTVEGTSTMW